jgi:hypothetical protein
VIRVAARLGLGTGALSFRFATASAVVRKRRRAKRKRHQNCDHRNDGSLCAHTQAEPMRSIWMILHIL